MSDATDQPAILFTAFEPSGDDHASAVIAELRRRRPERRIFAWGGPRMERAGAEIVARTGTDAVVGVPTLDKIREHQQINRDVAAWLERHPEVRLHVPVDSPAANFPICAIAKRLGRRVVHLVAPQLWAWGPWRVRKLRRCTDLVLCLLPFEEAFFAQRAVPARFIGHPLFDEPLDLDDLARRAEAMPQGDPNVAILPGSRPAELRRNFPVMLAAYRVLRERHPELRGCIAATTPEVEAELRRRADELGGWPEALELVVDATDVVVRWASVALAVSGTVTLQVARQRRPMVIMYKTNELTYKALGRLLITTKQFALPNLIAGAEIVPELIPYFKGHERLVDAAETLLGDEAAQAAQREALGEAASRFAGRNAARNAADAIEEMLDASAPPTVSEPLRI